MEIILWIVFCYFLGSIPCSLLLAKAFSGVDIRYLGSGNIGATNVMRTAGFKIALLALAADIFKGVIVGGLSLYWFYDKPVVIVLASVAVVLGHCYSILLKFKGGKGVATAVGIIICLMPMELLYLAIVFAISLIVWRYVSLSVLLAALVLPFVALFQGEPGYLFILSLFLPLIIFFRHRENIQRLRWGTEPKIGEKA